MKKLQTESFWIRKKNDSYIKKHTISLPENNEVLIKTIYSGISYGTEKVVYTGKVPKSQKFLMRCPYQDGEFGANVKYGYMNVGKVIEGSKAYKGTRRKICRFSIYRSAWKMATHRTTCEHN